MSMSYYDYFQQYPQRYESQKYNQNRLQNPVCNRCSNNPCCCISVCNKCFKNPCCCHVEIKQINREDQELIELSKTSQISKEKIRIEKSKDVQITSIENQSALTVQSALQATIALILSISINDDAKSVKLKNEIQNFTSIKQANLKDIAIIESESVIITTEKKDSDGSIQLLFSILLALLSQLDIN